MGVILIVSFLVLMFIGMPIAFALILCSSLTLTLTDFSTQMVIIQRVFNGLDKFPVLACPLFILAGYIMEGSSMFSTSGGLGILQSADALEEAWELLQFLLAQFLLR